ncbi:hypothetical protein EMCRGX_G001864 [Ephydatia muelleri]
MEGQLNNSVSQRKLYPRGTGQLNNSVTQRKLYPRGMGQLNNSVSQRKLYPRGTLNNSVTQRKLYPRGTVDGYNLVRTFAAVHTARMGKLVPCHHSGAWQKPSLDIIWKKNDLKID